MIETNITLPDPNKPYQEMWSKRKKVIEKYLPKAKFINKSYANRRNLWRSNVPKRISKFVVVPDWFINMKSLDALSIAKKLRYELIEDKPNFMIRFIQYLKRKFK